MYVSSHGSLSIQTRLYQNSLALNIYLERLSSGSRINSAKDDSAGFSIANRLDSQVRGLAQAKHNSLDGISLVQVTEGALNEINHHLQRIRELTVQGLNETLSRADVKAIQKEIDQRLVEIDMIGTNTQFNGIKVFQSPNPLTLQVGAHDYETVEVNLPKISVESLGLSEFRLLGPQGVQGTSLADNPNNLPLMRYIPGGNAIDMGFESNSPRKTEIIHQLFGQDTTVQFIRIGSGFDGDGFYDIDDLQRDLQTHLGLSQVTLGSSSTVAGVSTGYVFADHKGRLYVALTLGDKTNSNDLKVLEENGLEYGTTYFLELDLQTKKVGYFPQAGIVTFDPWSVDFGLMDEGATIDPLSVIDEAIWKIDNARGSLGAMHNRLIGVGNMLDQSVNDLKASKSRLVDADYAVELSQFTRTQILQNAGYAMLVQANLAHSSILTLLKG